MDYEAVNGKTLAHALRGLSVNLLVRDVLQEVEFLRTVFGMQTYKVSQDFAICVHGDSVFQLHADHTFTTNALYGLLPESALRGAGIELRLHEADPDLAAERASAFANSMVLAPPSDKSGHGLREAIILSPHGYAWVPSRRISDKLSAFIEFCAPIVRWAFFVVGHTSVFTGLAQGDATLAHRACASCQ
jgi:hypothetical protein